MTLLQNSGAILFDTSVYIQEIKIFTSILLFRNDSSSATNIFREYSARQFNSHTDNSKEEHTEINDIKQSFLHTLYGNYGFHSTETVCSLCGNLREKTVYTKFSWKLQTYKGLWSA